MQRQVCRGKKNRSEAAFERVMEKLQWDDSKLLELRKTFADLEQNRRPQGCVHDTADGFLLSFLQLNYSQIELRAMFGIGGSRATRLQAELKDPALRQKKLHPHTPKHAFSDVEKEYLKKHILTWNPKLEDGFPRQHRRQKRFFTEEGITWKKLWEKRQVSEQ